MIALLALITSLRAEAQTATAVEQELINLEQTLGDATIKKDRATLERVFAADFMYTHSNGVVMNKAEEIADTMSGDSKWTATTFADLKVRVYGDVAIVTGVQTLQGTAKGYVSGPRRFTDLFVKRDGRWQMIGGQTTLVPRKWHLLWSSSGCGLRLRNGLTATGADGATPDARRGSVAGVSLLIA